MVELEEYFVFKCNKGLEERGLVAKAAYTERLEYEISAIRKLGFCGYFLIVQDFLSWARKNNIYVGPGRGSAAGSLVAFVLNITQLDPLKWNLLFERFINPDRASRPDIDIDIEKRHRDDVIKYVTKKYGKNRVAHIGTFNLMRAKAAVKSVARTLGHPYIAGDQLSKLLLDPIHGKPQPLTTSIEKVKELDSFYNSPGTNGEILRWALKLENIISSVGVHASGIVIAGDSLMRQVPLFLSKEKEITTQWDMVNIEDTGLIKFDFLGLDALTKIHRCIDFIKESHNIDIDINNIDLEDPKVFEKLRGGDSVGIFQLEASTGMRDLMIQIRPTSIEDLVALVSIFRPGPLSSPYKKTYLKVRAGTIKPEYLVPELEPILEPTGGWCIYQENVMEIAKKLCGYTGSEADDLRKAIGKKKQKLMDEHESKFKQGWTGNGLPKAAGNELWDQIVSFASYAFNKSHAAAYALITYQTAWLKAHYTVEWMAAVMISEAEDRNQDRIIQYIAECKRLGIKVLPPDINISGETFTVCDEKAIRFGLGPIKNIGACIDTVLDARQDSPFVDFADFCKRVDLSIVNRLKLESLIRAGTFDSFNFSRGSLLVAVDDIWEYRKKYKIYESKLSTYTKRLTRCTERLVEIEKGIKKNPLKHPVAPEKPTFPAILHREPLSEEELQKAEHDLLGFFVTSHPLESVDIADDRFVSVEVAKQLPAGTKVSIASVITSIGEITTKKSKQKMAFLGIEDLTGTSEVVIFPYLYTKVRSLIEKVKPIVIQGTIDLIEIQGKRVVKIRASDIARLDKLHKEKPQTVQVSVPLAHAEKIAELLGKFRGNLHRVKLSLQLEDGTKLRLADDFKIGNHRGAFMQELAKIMEYNSAGWQYSTDSIWNRSNSRPT